MALLLSGALIADYISLRSLRHGGRTILAACVVRLLVAPILILLVAKFIPFDQALKSVLILQAAMPAAIFPIVVTKVNDGDVPAALQVVLGTSLIGLVTIPCGSASASTGSRRDLLLRVVKIDRGDQVYRPLQHGIAQLGSLAAVALRQLHRVNLGIEIGHQRGLVHAPAFGFKDKLADSLLFALQENLCLNVVRQRDGHIGFTPSGKIGPISGRMTCATATRSSVPPPSGTSENSTASPVVSAPMIIALTFRRRVAANASAAPAVLASVSTINTP